MEGLSKIFFKKNTKMSSVNQIRQKNVVLGLKICGDNIRILRGSFTCGYSSRKGWMTQINK